MSLNVLISFFIFANNNLVFSFNFLFLLFPEGLKEHFSKFGDIAEVMVMKDPTTRRSRYSENPKYVCNSLFCSCHLKCTQKYLLSI